MLSNSIFDVEGTLIDSVTQNIRSFQDAFERCGHRVGFDELQAYAGLDSNQIVELLVPGLPDWERENILKAQSEIYESFYLDSVKPFDHVRDVFTALAKHGRIALVTDCKGVPFNYYLSLLGIGDLIAATACGDDVGHGKPDPRLIGAAMRKLGCLPGEAVMIGDTPYDAEAAIEAGTKAVGLLTGGFSAKVLLEAGCFAVARDLRELPSYLQFGRANTEGLFAPDNIPALRSA